MGPLPLESSGFGPPTYKLSPTYGGLAIWHPEDTKSGPPPLVVASFATLMTPKIVNHLCILHYFCTKLLGLFEISKRVQP